jgi:hypothetical protein
VVSCPSPPPPGEVVGLLALTYATRKSLNGLAQARPSKVLRPDVGYLMQGRRSGFSSALAPQETFTEQDPVPQHLTNCNPLMAHSAY